MWKVRDMDGTVVGITADDLTGAADAAAVFARPGAPVSVSLDLRLPTVQEERRVFGLTTESRGRPAEEVFDIVADSASALRMAGASLIYKKLDSNLRGNVGTELAAVLDTIGGPVLFAPAFPARGRTTVEGIVRLHGVPVAETEMGRDPQSPARYSHLPQLLASQRPELAVVHCPLEVVRQGAKAVRGLCRPEAVLAADAETDADLDTLAEALLTPPALRAAAGSAGLAGALARRLFGEAVPREQGTASRGPVLAVLASSSGALTAQVAAAAAGGAAVVPFACDKLSRAEHPVRQLEMVTAAALAALAEGKDTVLHATGALPQVERPVELVVEFLARLALVAIRQGTPVALLAGGGSTAQAVLNVLATRALEIDDEPLPGIAAGRIVGGELAGRPVVLKAGAAGGETAVAEVLGYLRTRAAEEAP